MLFSVHLVDLNLDVFSSIFFANAGKAHMSKPLDVSPEVWNDIMRINTLSYVRQLTLEPALMQSRCFLAVKHASEAMKVTSSTKKESSGSIVLTASGRSLFGD